MVLVATETSTGNPIVIFSSCVVPGELKNIGTIDCPDGIVYPCGTPPTPTTPTSTPTTPTPTIPPEVTNCCLCDYIGQTVTVDTLGQEWGLSNDCGITFVPNGTGAEIINCGGTFIYAEWADSGNVSSINGAPTYDVIVSLY